MKGHFKIAICCIIAGSFLLACSPSKPSEQDALKYLKFKIDDFKKWKGKPVGKLISVEKTNGQKVGEGTYKLEVLLKVDCSSLGPTGIRWCQNGGANKVWITFQKTENGWIGKSDTINSIK